MTIYFLKDLMSRKKRYVRSDQIKTIFVPQYENLTLKHIDEFARQYPDIALYLPDAPDMPKTPKQWVVNICAAVIDKPFRDWVA